MTWEAGEEAAYHSTEMTEAQEDAIYAAQEAYVLEKFGPGTSANYGWGRGRDSRVRADEGLRPRRPHHELDGGRPGA